MFFPINHQTCNKFSVLNFQIFTNMPFLTLNYSHNNELYFVYMSVFNTRYVKNLKNVYGTIIKLFFKKRNVEHFQYFDFQSNNLAFNAGGSKVITDSRKTILDRFICILFYHLSINFCILSKNFLCLFTIIILVEILLIL